MSQQPTQSTYEPVTRKLSRKQAQRWVNGRSPVRSKNSRSARGSRA